MSMQTDKKRDDLLWMIAAGGLVLGAVITVSGLLGQITAATVIGIILLAFGGVAMFMRLANR